MPKEGLEDRFDYFIEGLDLDDEDLALIVHEALSAFEDDEAAVAACVDWAKQADKLFELNQALLEHMAASTPKLPPGDEPPDDSEGHPG